MVQPTYPGVYTQEAPPAPGPIQGVSPSGLALVGFTKRGPIDTPTLSTSFAEYTTKFGTFTADSLTPTEAYSFFTEGGSQLWQIRTVHSDAASASIDWTVDVTGEVLTSTATVSGAYALETNKIPMVSTVAASIQIEFESATTNNVFRDDGAGSLAFYAAGSTGAGGTASYDPETGEISVQLTTPGDYVGGANDVTISYSYKVAKYTMAWPGDEGDYFRVRVTGSQGYYDQDTASYSAFTFLVEENTTPTATTATWEVRETFDPVTFSDSNNSNYYVTVVNDERTGSDLVTVTDYGNAQDIADLAGTAVTAEDFSSGQTPAYDGATKQFVYALPGAASAGVAEGTLSMAFKFTESLLRIGTGDGTAAPVCTALGYPIDAGGGAVSTAKVTVALTLTGAGAITLSDDGSGNLRTSPFPGTVHGTVSYTTGLVTLNISADTVVAGTAITVSAVYTDVVTVADDGDGNMSVQTPVAGISPPLKFQLNSNGTNTVDYDAGEVTLTWQISGAPALGPAGVDVSSVAATKTGAVGTYLLSPGDNFDLDVDNVGAATSTFDAASGYVEDTTAYPVADQNGLTVLIGIDSYANQTVTFAGVTTTAASIVNQINTQIAYGRAYENGGQVRIESDKKGTGSSVAIAGGTHGLTFAAPVAGTGDVVDITAVTATEVKTVIEADTTATVTVNVDGSFTISSPTTGLTSELDFVSAITALGLSIETITGSTGTTGETATYYTQPDSEVTYAMANGSDGSATDRTDVTFATLAATNGGMYALNTIDENLQVVIADFQTDESVIRDVIGYCESKGDKFGIFSVPEGLTYQEAVNWKRNTLSRYTNYGAIYYPHIQITDPVSLNTINVPCGGHVAGIYARTDNNSNVAKSPAGTTDGALSYFEGLEVSLQKDHVGYLYGDNINCLVDWSNTGTVVWGARTMEQPGGSFKYISERRTFMFVEKSIYNSTQIHVFENNGPTLWNAIRGQVEGFLGRLYRAQYFKGASAAEAFRVVCDGTNNTATTIALGLVYCDVYLATQTPGEFLVFTFAKITQ